MQRVACACYHPGVDPKKVFLLILVAAAGGVAAFLFISERFAQQQLRTAVAELAGNLSPGDMQFFNTALDRRWFHDRMPPHGDDKAWGREEWKDEWKANMGEAGFRRHVVETKVLEAVDDPLYPGGRTVETEWLIGVPGQWGTTIRYRMIWIHDQGDWKLARLQETGRTEGASPPPLPEKLK